MLFSTQEKTDTIDQIEICHLRNLYKNYKFKTFDIYHVVEIRVFKTALHPQKLALELINNVSIIPAVSRTFPSISRLS